MLHGSRWSTAFSFQAGVKGFSSFRPDCIAHSHFCVPLSSFSQGSWGSGKDQCSRELLVSSIFAAASRKRKKSKEKPQPSSSDDDLDSVFPKKEIPGQKPNHHLQAEAQSETRPNAKQQAPAEERKENGRTVELMPKAKREHRNSLFLKDKTPPRHSSSSPSLIISGSPTISHQAAPRGKSSLSDPPSQLDENTSDLGTMSSGASVPRSRPKKWSGGAPPDLPPGVCMGQGGGAGASAGAEVSSITSDYSTTSSITFLTGAESSALSPELQGGEEADDERSELISEGRPMETDSESDFPVFAPGGGSSQSTPRPEPSQEKAEAREAADGGVVPKLEARRLFPSHRMIECDTLSRRWSLRQKTDSESSMEGVAGSGERSSGRSESSTRLSRVLEVMKKGRSTSSLSSSSRSESERAEPAWHLKITERLKLRIRTSADDMFAQKNRAQDARAKKKNIRRRHTLGGQRDFAELAVINDWREQGGVDKVADLSLLDHLKPRCSSEDFSVRDWISRERCRGSEPSVELAPRAVPEDDPAEAQGVAPESSPPPPPPPPAAPDAQPPAGEQVNGSGLPVRSKASLGADAHPHKLSGAQVVRSRFYQYLWGQTEWMSEWANVVIWAKVTAQYFFYKVNFMYLLYILCIGLHDCYWINAEEMFMCISTDSSAVLENKTHTDFPPELDSWQNVTLPSTRCLSDGIELGRLFRSTNEKRLLKNAGGTFRKKESRFSSSSYKRYEECITRSFFFFFGLTLVACDNIVIFKNDVYVFFCFCLYLKSVGLVDGCFLSWVLWEVCGFFPSTVTTARYELGGLL